MNISFKQGEQVTENEIKEILKFIRTGKYDCYAAILEDDNENQLISFNLVWSMLND